MYNGYPPFYPPPPYWGQPQMPNIPIPQIPFPPTSRKEYKEAIKTYRKLEKFIEDEEKKKKDKKPPERKTVGSKLSVGEKVFWLTLLFPFVGFIYAAAFLKGIAFLTGMLQTVIK